MRASIPTLLLGCFICVVAQTVTHIATDSAATSPASPQHSTATVVSSSASSTFRPASAQQQQQPGNNPQADWSQYGYPYYPYQNMPYYGQYYFPGNPNAVDVTTPSGMFGFFDNFKNVDTNSAAALGAAALAVLFLPVLMGCDVNGCPTPKLINPFAQGKSKRSAQTSGLTLDYAYQLYLAAMKSDQCMDRVVCELGGMVKNMNKKTEIFSIADSYVPAVIRSYPIFREGAMSPSRMACKNYACSAKIFSTRNR